MSPRPKKITYSGQLIEKLATERCVCATCHAQPGETCSTSSGKPAQYVHGPRWHKARDGYFENLAGDSFVPKLEVVEELRVEGIDVSHLRGNGSHLRRLG